MMVTALRDVQGAAEPSDLLYEAFRGTTFLSLVELGIDPADPDRVTDKHIPPPLKAHDLSALTSSPSHPIAPSTRTRPPTRFRPPIRRRRGPSGTSPRSGWPRPRPTATATATSPPSRTPNCTSPGRSSTATASTSGLHRPARGPHRATTLTELTADWPQPHWQLAIDDGLAEAGYLDSHTLALLGGSPNGRVMQKVLPHPLVVHYLEGGYDRFAGYVHQVVDVMDLTTPSRLYTALGLTEPPFATTDDSVHVLRWHAHVGELLRTPYGGPDLATCEAMPAAGSWSIPRSPGRGSHPARAPISGVQGRQPAPAARGRDLPARTVGPPGPGGAVRRRHHPLDGRVMDRIREGYYAGWRGEEFPAAPGTKKCGCTPRSRWWASPLPCPAGS